MRIAKIPCADESAAPPLESDREARREELGYRRDEKVSSASAASVWASISSAA
jgi:hypothetical protein